MAYPKPHIFFDDFDAVRKQWGEDGAIQVLDAVEKQGCWWFIFWQGDNSVGVCQTPAEVAANAESHPITNVTCGVEVAVSWTPNSLSISERVEIRPWLQERRQLLDVCEDHDNPMLHRRFCSLLTKEDNQVRRE